MKIIRVPTCQTCIKKAHEGHDHGHMSTDVGSRKFGIYHVEWVLCYKTSPDGQQLEFTIQGLDKSHRGNEIKEMFEAFIPKMNKEISVKIVEHHEGAHQKNRPPPDDTPPPPESDKEGVASYVEQDRLIQEQAPPVYEQQQQQA